MPKGPRGGKRERKASEGDVSHASDQGAELLRENRYAEAVRFLSGAVLKDPADARLQLQWGSPCRRSAGMPKRSARSPAQRALPHEAAYHLHAAASYFALGDLQVALPAAHAACQRGPEAPAPLYLYGQIALGLDRLFDAERAVLRVTERHADWADAWVNLGVAAPRIPVSRVCVKLGADGCFNRSIVRRVVASRCRPLIA